jgi:hypothetical protein
LHGGVLEQGRKVKTQAGDLFFLPIALVAFTRFGYLMRRVFFRLMHDDLNAIVDGLDRLEEQGIAMLDCRRAQFSAKEPIVRLRMICQSWKVMFQAEYSSGQPLRMLVDLRASVADALAGNLADESAGTTRAPVVAAKAAAASAGASFKARESAPKFTPSAKPAVASAPAAAKLGAKSGAKSAVDDSSPQEFDVSGAPAWDPDSVSPPAKRK